MPAGSGEHADELLRNADVAMYTAKAAGKRRAAVFEPTMHAAIVARHALSAELKRSMGRGELAVFYQPIVELDTGRIAGAEALVRWRHPTRGLVSPDEFIPLAEENGLILTLGRWVLAEACEQVAAWERGPGLTDDFFLSVNLSPVQLQQAEFLSEIESILKATGLAPQRLVVELTETAMFQDTETTIAKLAASEAARGADRPRRLRDRLLVAGLPAPLPGRHPEDRPGVRRAVGSDADEWAFAHAIVALGHTLGLRIIAEGIEEAAQAEKLRGLGCELGQGFYFARPVEAGAIEAAMALERPSAAAIRFGLETAQPAEIVA